LQAVGGSGLIKKASKIRSRRNTAPSSRQGRKVGFGNSVAVVQGRQVWRRDEMIMDIQLKDFIAHKDTKIEFGKGITIFVGHNGSGKSSIIDAVTFALFGKHTRKSNRNLVRRGANSAMVQMRFTLNSKEFQAIRSLNGSGLQSFSQLAIVSDGGKEMNRPIIGGERKQFGESMSSEIAKVLGMDYE